MNIPNVWFFGAFPKVRGRSCLRPTGPVAYVLLQVCGSNDVNHKFSSMFTQISCQVLQKCPFDLVIFCVQNESECMSLISGSLVLPTGNLTNIRKCILQHEGATERASFTE